MIKKVIFGAGIVLVIAIFIAVGIVFPAYRSDIPLDVITLGAGFIALIIYYKQKSDDKKDAANILYIEITNAESIMKLSKEGLEKGILAEQALSSLSMPTETWSKYKYLFVRDLDRKEWDSISDFYNKSQLFDEAVQHVQSYFKKNEEQIRISLYKARLEFVKNNPVDISKIDTDEKEKAKWESFEKINLNFYNQFMKDQNLYFYRPDKPIIDAKFYLANINLELSGTSVGTKLKKLGNIKN